MLFTEVLFAEKSELIVSLSFSYPLGALKASIIGILAQTLHWRHVMICSFRRTTLHSAPTHAVHGLHTNVCEHITSHNHSCSSCVSHNPEWLHAKRSSGFTHPWHIHTHTLTQTLVPVISGFSACWLVPGKLQSFCCSCVWRESKSKMIHNVPLRRQNRGKKGGHLNAVLQKTKEGNLL